MTLLLKLKKGKKMKAFLDFISLFSLLVAVCDAVKTRTFINSNLTMNESKTIFILKNF